MAAVSAALGAWRETGLNELGSSIELSSEDASSACYYSSSDSEDKTKRNSENGRSTLGSVELPKSLDLHLPAEASAFLLKSKN